MSKKWEFIKVLLTKYHGCRGYSVLLSKLRVAVFCIVALSSVKAFAQVQFEDITELSGGPFHIGESWGASWGFMDDDIFPDLFVSNHGTLPSLLRNNADGTFSQNVAIADLEAIWVSEPLQDTHGGVWADYDNDGDQDLFATRSSSGARFHVFENNGLGFFEERGGPLGIGGNGGGRLPALFDYTNDGLLDVALSRNGPQGAIFRQNLNNFVEQTSETGLSGECSNSPSGMASRLFDDNKLIYLCMSERGFPFGTFDTTTLPFTDVSGRFDNIGTNTDAVLADFNNDLKLDLFALRGSLRPRGAERISDNRVEAWLTAGGRTNFVTSVTFAATGPITVTVYARVVDDPNSIFVGESGFNPASNPVTLDPANPDHSGISDNLLRLGVFIGYDQAVGEWTISLSGGGGGQSEGAYFVVDGTGLGEPSVAGLRGIDGPTTPRFLLNDGDRLLDSGARGIASVSCGGIAAADFDNDMDIDLYLSCRTSMRNLPNRLYLNDGAGNFSLVSGSIGAEGPLGAGIDGLDGTAEMVVTADHDLDGLVDLFVTNGNRLFPHVVQDGFSGGGADNLYRNTTANGNHWLQFDLEGVNSNRDGRGAKVTVTANGVSQLREQNGQYHRWSQNSSRLHFGLAANTTANVVIDWPDGTTDSHNDVLADRVYLVTQGGALTDITPGPDAASIEIDSVVANEGSDATLEVSIVRPNGTNNVVSVDYQTVALTATSGDDFQATSGQLVFQPNQTVSQINVPINTDSITESDETFAVSLFNSEGNRITQSNGIVTVQDSGGGACGRPDFSAGADRGLFIWRDCGGTENWLVRGTAGGSTVSALYIAEFLASAEITNLTEFSFEGNDSATLLNLDTQIDLFMRMSRAGEDGIEFSLAAGSELCVTLEDTSQNIIVGANNLTFTSSVNLVTLDNTCAVLGEPDLSVGDAVVSEGDGSVEIEVTLSAASEQTVTASYFTSNGSALAGSDYELSTGVIEFPPTELSTTISVTVLDDSIFESPEDFTVVVTGVTNAQLADDTGLVLIGDDDLTACGEPTFSPATDAGVFLWQDCGNTDNWLVRGTAGGGSAIEYNGSFNSDAPISSLTPFSFEGRDSATLANGDQLLEFFFRMANAGVDGIEFSLQPGSTCFDVDTPTPVVVGQNNELLTPPFDVFTFDPC